MADGGLLGPAAVREIAARLGVRPAKRLGQNFVIDPGTVRRIVALAGLSADDVVLEVGPGFGSLTLGLLPAARRVIAVELDSALAAELPRTVAEVAPGLAPRLEVINADAARVTSLPGGPPSALPPARPAATGIRLLMRMASPGESLAPGPTERSSAATARAARLVSSAGTLSAPSPVMTRLSWSAGDTVTSSNSETA